MISHVSRSDGEKVKGKGKNNDCYLFFLTRPRRATTPEEKIECLKIMIKECPKHKSSENMLRNLTRRYKKLRQSMEKAKKSGK